MSKLIGQGGFGCIYYPGITCNGETNKNRTLVSKLHVDDNDSKNEVKIGKFVMQIKNYRQFFSPIVKTCPVNLNAIDKKNIGDCEVVDKHSDAKFVISYVRYINGSNLDKYILGFEKQDFVITVINSYYYLINSLQILNKNDIIHFDIKGENIMHDSVAAIILDFGLSIKISDITISNLDRLREYFYTYATDYYIWCPEIHIISYIVLNNGRDGHSSESLFNLDMLNIVLDDIANNNRILEFFSDDFKILYHKSLYNFMKQFIDKPNIFVIRELIKYNKTWDMYSLSVLYLKVIYKRGERDHGERDHSRGVRDQDSTNKSISNILSQLFLLNINPDPRKRRSFESTKRLLYRLFAFGDHDLDGLGNLNNDIEFTLNSNQEIDFKTRILPYLHIF